MKPLLLARRVGPRSEADFGRTMSNPSASFRPIQGGKIRGHLLTKTYAKAGGGLRGWCIAVCVDGKIVRPVKPRHLGQAAPFWSDEVEKLELGMCIEFTVDENARKAEFPHASEDVQASARARAQDVLRYPPDRALACRCSVAIW